MTMPIEAPAADPAEHASPVRTLAAKSVAPLMFILGFCSVVGMMLILMTAVAGLEPALALVRSEYPAWVVQALVLIGMLGLFAVGLSMLLITAVGWQRLIGIYRDALRSGATHGE